MTGLREIPGAEEIYPKTRLFTYIKIGFLAAEHFVSLTNSSYHIGAFGTGALPSAIISYVFTADKGVHAILKRGGASYLCAGGKIISQVDHGELNLKWTGAGNTAVGITRIGGSPLFCLSAEDAWYLETPETVTLSANGGWLLGESGKLYRLDSRKQMTGYQLPAMTVKPQSAECFGEFLCLTGLDTSGEYIGSRVYVFQIKDRELLLERELFFPADVGHYQCGDYFI